jgi:hypothetical protein
VNTRSLPALLAVIGAALGVAELISTVQLWARGGQDSYPLFALGFALLFGLGAYLVRTGRAVTGSILVGLLATFEVVDYPQWAKHGVLDWIFDTAVAVVSLAGIGVAIALLVTRRSVRSRSAGTREA